MDKIEIHDASLLNDYLNEKFGPNISAVMVAEIIKREAREEKIKWILTVLLSAIATLLAAMLGSQ